VQSHSLGRGGLQAGELAYLAHFHTAGVPGRHEIDTDSQELSYRPIAQTLVDLGYTGFLAHEYYPLRDSLKSLDEAITLCDV
jgi:hydroxypyruvate isomerase